MISTESRTSEHGEQARVSGEPKRTPGVPFALDRLNSDLMKLQEMILRLNERLQPLMVENNHDVVRRESKPCPPMCKVAQEIMNAQDMVYQLCQRIEVIEMSLDI